jgi:GrpB-like predicted nucleotidyltransferase (UPF0157 family)
MPPPIKVELQPHDPKWVDSALAESQLLASALGTNLMVVHHVGSTAISAIHAKPVLDLMPVVEDLQALDGARGSIEALGYEWWGEFGLPGRRYCTKSQPATGRRLIQLHCYESGSTEIVRHLAFRDYLRQAPAIATRYEEEKMRCQRLHPEDSHAYSDCKSGWIKAIEAEALAWFHLHRRCGA